MHSVQECFLALIEGKTLCRLLAGEVYHCKLLNNTVVARFPGYAESPWLVQNVDFNKYGQWQVFE